MLGGSLVFDDQGIPNVVYGSLPSIECIKQPGAAYGQNQPLSHLAWPMYSAIKANQEEKENKWHL